MPEKNLTEIAEKADMIVDGYAFTKKENGIAVLNLRDPDSAMFISPEGKMLETNMDEIEQVIVHNIWENDKEFMESHKA